jgi:hypothetical protein
MYAHTYIYENNTLKPKKSVKKEEVRGEDLRK